MRFFTYVSTLFVLSASAAWAGVQSAKCCVGDTIGRYGVTCFQKDCSQNGWGYFHPTLGAKQFECHAGGCFTVGWLQYSGQD